MPKEVNSLVSFSLTWLLNEYGCHEGRQAGRQSVSQNLSNAKPACSLHA